RRNVQHRGTGIGRYLQRHYPLRTRLLVQVEVGLQPLHGTGHRLDRHHPPGALAGAVDREAADVGADVDDGRALLAEAGVLGRDDLQEPRAVPEGPGLQGGLDEVLVVDEELAEGGLDDFVTDHEASAFLSASTQWRASNEGRPSFPVTS